MPVPPMQDSGRSRHIVEVPEAIVVPPDTSRARQRAGVLHADGSYCAQAAVWRFDRAMTIEPVLCPTPKQRLAGTWLWAGSLFNHFGHFLVEGMSRLWAADPGGPCLDGILYIPKRVRQAPVLNSFQRDILDAWGLEMPVRIAREPTSVERLIVPRQGFGLGSLISGTPEMREAVRSRFAKDIEPGGPDRLYVSRSRLDPALGGIIGEDLIEAGLAANGYEIFHPQDHGISIQLARYKAASQIIICDGSAGHLFAYVGTKQQSVAYLPRRSFWDDGPIKHIAAFTGRRPLVVKSLVREWRPVGPEADRGVSLVSHDFNALRTELAANGFVQEKIRWPTLEHDAIERRLASMGGPGSFEESELATAN